MIMVIKNNAFLFSYHGCIVTAIIIAAVVLVHDVEGGNTYGVDVSYPMHHEMVSTNYEWLPHNNLPNNNASSTIPNKYDGMSVQPLGNRNEFYNDLIQGCIDFYGPKKGKRCIESEKERVKMSLRQPQSMINYTQTGYTKIKAPESVFRLLKEFWDNNKHKAKTEQWNAGNSYTNHWESPTFIVSVEDTAMVGGGRVLKSQIWNAAHDTISEWTGQQLIECSLYGIRIYREGAVLATHVDRLPLVSSAIINVDQDVDEPWPLEVIGHDGIAQNVTMEPGDLVLYESHSILHGRPFPLKGRYMANVFIHFEPIGKIGQEIQDPGENALPPYVIPGSPEENNWRKKNPKGHKVPKKIEKMKFEKGTTLAHVAVIEQNIENLVRIIELHPEYIHSKDINHFTPLHEAVRRKNEEIVHYLISKGANIHSLTIDSKSVLYWAKQSNNIPVIKFLKQLGAK